MENTILPFLIQVYSKQDTAFGKSEMNTKTPMAISSDYIIQHLESLNIAYAGRQHFTW